MGVLDVYGYRRKEGAVLGVNVGYPIVTNGRLCALLRLLWGGLVVDSYEFFELFC